MGQGKVYIFCTISFLLKILLVKLKYLYIQYAWISIMKKQNSNQNVKVEKMVVLVKTFDHYYHKFQLFQLSCEIVKEFETEISKFHHGYLQSAVWKAFYNFKIKKSQEVRHNKFSLKMFKIMRSLKCLKTTVELTSNHSLYVLILFDFHFV